MKTHLKNLENPLEKRNLPPNLQHLARKRFPNQTFPPHILSPSAKIIDLSSCPCLTTMNQQCTVMSPKEESDADGESEVVTPDPEEETLPKTD